MDPNLIRTVPLIKGKFEHRDTRGGKTMGRRRDNSHQQAKEWLRLPAARREVWNRYSLSPQEDLTLPTPLFQISRLQNSERQ